VTVTTTSTTTSEPADDAATGDAVEPDAAATTEDGDGAAEPQQAVPEAAPLDQDQPDEATVDEAPAEPTEVDRIVAALDPMSPISDESLETVADRVSRRFKAARKALGKPERKRVRAALQTVYELVQARDPEETWPRHRYRRLELSREMEKLQYLLLGSEPFVPDFYAGGKLAIVRAFEPVKIRESIDPARIERHFIRFEERAEKAIRRLDWFLERCGLERENDDEDDIVPPWEQPYGKIDNYRELLWGTPRPKKRPPR